MEWAADLLHMLASAERSTMAHFEQWNHGRPDDSVQREAPMTEVPPFDAGGSEAGSTAQDESVAAKDARWLDNPQVGESGSPSVVHQRGAASKALLSRISCAEVRADHVGDWRQGGHIH
jgi:hypothetical protein